MINRRERYSTYLRLLENNSCRVALRVQLERGSFMKDKFICSFKLEQIWSGVTSPGVCDRQAFLKRELVWRGTSKSCPLFIALCYFPFPVSYSYVFLPEPLTYHLGFSLDSFYHFLRNVLTRRREYGTYLATARRHRRRLKMQKRDE